MTYVDPAVVTGTVAARGEAGASRTLATGLDAEWRSLFLHHDRNVGRSDPYDTPPTPDQALVVVLRGECELGALVGGRWRSARRTPGSIGMTAGGERSRIQWRAGGVGQTFDSAHLYLPQRLFQDARDHYGKAGVRTTDAPMTGIAFDDPVTAGVIDGMVRAIGAGAPELYAEAAAQWLCVHLLSQSAGWHHRVHDRRHGNPLTDARLVRVTEFIETRLADPPTLDALAAEAGVSKFHFVRLFKERVGETPVAYLTRRRIDRAFDLLATTDVPISAVAASCGYKHLSAFDAAFRRWRHCTPTEVRRRRPPRG